MTKNIILITEKSIVKLKIHSNVVGTEVYENKFLGVTDDKQHRKSYVNNVQLKISKTIAVLYRTKDILNQNS